MTSATPGDEIYRNFQEGPGPSGLAVSAALVDGVVGRYQGRVDQILRLRARMEAAWQGSAAEAADRGLRPLVSEHGLAARSLHVAQDLTSRQVGSFNEAKNAVVPVPPVPEGVDALAMFADGDLAASYFQQVVRHNQAAQHNVDVMDGYAGASRYNTVGQPTSYGQIDGVPPGVHIEDTADHDGVSTVNSEPVATTGADAGAVPGVGPDERPVDRPGAVPEGSSVRPGSTLPAATVPAGAVPVTGVVGPDVADGPRPGPTGAGGGILLRGGSGDGGAADAPARGGKTGGSVRGTPAAGTARAVMVAAGPGRGGMGFAGLPGPVGRGRGEEDTERRTPAYLDGGDPEELWDTDELTAPPAIGDEDR